MPSVTGISSRWQTIMSNHLPAGAWKKRYFPQYRQNNSDFSSILLSSHFSWGSFFTSGLDLAVYYSIAVFIYWLKKKNNTTNTWKNIHAKGANRSRDAHMHMPLNITVVIQMSGNKNRDVSDEQVLKGNSYIILYEYAIVLLGFQASVCLRPNSCFRKHN